MAGRYGEAGLGPQGDGAAGPARERRRASRARFERGDHRRRGVQRRPARSAAPARRSSARAAAPAGSACSSSGERRPLAAADDLEEAEAVDRGALERLRQDRVDRGGGAPAGRSRGRVGRSMPIEPAMPKRRIARAAAAAPASASVGGRQAAVDVEQGHGRRQAHPQRAAVEGDLAGRGLLEQLGPARLLEPVRAVRARAAWTADPLREARPGAGGSSVGARPVAASAGPRSGIASRTISARKAAPSVRPAAAARRQPPRCRRAWRCRAAGSMLGQPGRDHRAGAQAGQLDRGLEDRAVLDQDRAILADPFLVEPLSQADSRPRGAGRGSRTAAGRRRPNRSRRAPGPAPRRGPGSHSRRPCRAIRRWRDRRRAPRRSAA